MLIKPETLEVAFGACLPRNFRLVFCFASCCSYIVYSELRSFRVELRREARSKKAPLEGGLGGEP